MKTCTKCDIVKSFDDFYKAASKKGGHHAWCKDCMSEYKKAVRDSDPERESEKRKRWKNANRFVYALTHGRTVAKRRGHAACMASPEEIEQRFDGCCHVCGVHENDLNERLHLDHDHKTGAFRGWLCGNCNRALGLFQNSVELLGEAIQYLANSRNF